MNLIQITRAAIDHASLTEQVRSTSAGAVVTFLGTVRELTDGRRTLALEYEAYPEMAQRKLAELADEDRRRWPIEKLAVVHRVGRLELGDISVAVALSCPHRHQAFEACRFLIDRVKDVVPIWKKDIWSDGSSQWVHPGLHTAPAPTAE